MLLKFQKKMFMTLDSFPNVWSISHLTLADVSLKTFHFTLNFVDLSYNKLSNSSARALGKMLIGRSRLVALDLTNNHIEAQGAAAIAHALAKNTILKKLNLRLNRYELNKGICIFVRIIISFAKL